MTLRSTWKSTVWFQLRGSLLCARRGLLDVLSGLQRLPRHERPRGFEPLAESRTPLWSNLNQVEREYQVGKVQNLRCAARRLHGTLLPAGSTFSFWKQVGRTSRRRGYVPGRAIEGGCVVPRLGGGLCQLSNALYDVARQAECRIVERHGHSRAVAGASHGPDATVAWNYLDLRFETTQPLYLEVLLTRRSLLVRLLGLAPAAAPDKPVEAEAQASPSMYRDPIAYLLNDAWPEYRTHVSSRARPHDVLCLPSDSDPWAPPGFTTLHQARRTLLSRRPLADLAAALARGVPFQARHLVVEQSLLPYLWRAGVLGGRSFEVLMTGLPLRTRYALLDEAASCWPEHASLRQARVAPWLVEAEWQALQQAQRLVTPHTAVANQLGPRALLIPWTEPAVLGPWAAPQADVLAIGLPAATLALSGAYEVREAVQGLPVELWLGGPELEGPDFWDGVRVRRVSPHQASTADVVVLPALIEDQPRGLLAALAGGRPVIATEACGLGGLPGVTVVPFGHAAAIRQALDRVVDHLYSQLLSHA